MLNGYFSELSSKLAFSLILLAFNLLATHHALFEYLYCTVDFLISFSWPNNMAICSISLLLILPEYFGSCGFRCQVFSLFVAIWLLCLHIAFAEISLSGFLPHHQRCHMSCYRQVNSSQKTLNLIEIWMHLIYSLIEFYALDLNRDCIDRVILELG